MGPWWRKGCVVTTGQFGSARWLTTPRVTSVPVDGVSDPEFLSPASPPPYPTEFPSPASPLPILPIIHHARSPQTWRSSERSRSCYRGRRNEGYNPTQVGPWWWKGCAVTTGQFGFVHWRSSLAWHESQKHGVWAGQRLQQRVLHPLQQSQDHTFLRR